MPLWREMDSGKRVSVERLQGCRMTEMKKCKKCGAEAEIRKLGRIGNYYVAWTNCPNDTIGYDTEEEAIKAWNKLQERN